jgi:hypothetical protein
VVTSLAGFAVAFAPLISRLNCLALGRLGNDFEESEETLENGETKTKLVKVGTKFKAFGGESFDHEPHLLVELSLERKNRRVNGQEREGEGRLVHRADVLKDRTWALNGRMFRWTGKAKYEAGRYRQVWESIIVFPHSGHGIPPHFRLSRPRGTTIPELGRCCYLSAVSLRMVPLTKGMVDLSQTVCNHPITTDPQRVLLRTTGS